MKRLHYLPISLAIIALDALTKWLVAARIDLHESIAVIPNLFEIVHVRNTGAAFGIGANTGSPPPPARPRGRGGRRAPPPPPPPPGPPRGGPPRFFGGGWFLGGGGGGERGRES